MAKPSVGSIAMLLGAELPPKEIKGLAEPIYIFGGFGGGGCGTGCNVKLVVPVTSRGGFEPP